MKKYSIGVDIGGTNIKLGLVSSQGKVVRRDVIKTSQYGQTSATLIKVIIDSIESLRCAHQIKSSEILGVGIGFPGLIDPVRGVVKLLPNISGWKNVPVKKLMEAKLQYPVVIDNDVNVVTLGEWRFGAGKGFKDIICLTLGTGVGAGLILNDHLYRGPNYVAGELGHMPLNETGPDCNCGGFACFERYVGNQTLRAQAVKIFRRKHIQLEDVFALAHQKNAKALKFWQEVGGHIGNGLVGPVNLLNPSLIIVGGGVSNNWRFIRPMVHQIIQQRAMTVQAKHVKVVRATLGDDAGVIGAHVLVESS